MIASLLFAWIQGADFYMNLHREAVEVLPDGDGKRWLDVGCGPGLVSRLAAQRGYAVLGLDHAPGMIRRARWFGRHVGSSVRFEVGSVFELEAESADVVSAASLLAVLGDKQTALAALWAAVKPGGHLLIIEPTEKMTVANARLLMPTLPSKRKRGILLWSRAREGRAIDPTIFESVAAEVVERTELLDGMVNAWVLQKPGK